MAVSQPVPPAYIQARWAALRTAMKHRRTPAMLISCYPDVSYLTGFEGDDSWAIITPEQVWLVSDFRYQEQIAGQCPWVKPVIRRKGLAEEIFRILKKEGISSVGVQSENVSIRQMSWLSKFAKKPRVRLIPVDDMVIELRNIKDDHETGLIEQAIAIAEHAFGTLKARLRVGMTENDIAGLLTYEMRKRGASNSAFDPIVAAGANGSLPHYHPGPTKLSDHSALLVDWGAIFKGYRSDLTRMILVGNVDVKIKEIYRVVLDAQLAAIDAIKPGVSGAKVDQIARKIIARAGYGDHFGHGLGHGIGRDIHEQISLSKRGKTILKPGMIITVEPGIYLPGIGGVRIEDDVLVTAGGCRVLSSLPKDMESARL